MATTELSFSKFLEQQRDQVKQEKDLAKDTVDSNDTREEQLKGIIHNTESIYKAISGNKLDLSSINIDLSQITAPLENSVQIQLKQLEELTLARKIAEGSLEYDKESAQYRNTSGKEVTSKVSGKDIKKGGYIDFETASDRLTGQGKRVRESEANQLNLLSATTSVGTIGIGAAKSIGKVDDRKLSDIKADRYKEGFAGFKEMGKDWASLFGYKGGKEGGNEAWSVEKSRYADEFEKAGMGTKKEGMLKYEEITAKEKKEKDRLVSGIDIGRSANAESDNIESESEKQTKITSEDLALTKEQKKLDEEQVKLLKEIRDILKEPGIESGSKSSSNQPTSSITSPITSPEEDSNIPFPVPDINKTKDKNKPKPRKKPTWRDRLSKGFGKIGEATKKGLGTISSFASSASRFALPAALLYGGYQVGKAAYDPNKYLGLDPENDPTVQQRIAAGTAALTETATFGLVDGKELGNILAETPEGKKLAEKNRKEIEGVGIGDVGEFAGMDLTGSTPNDTPVKEDSKPGLIDRMKGFFGWGKTDNPSASGKITSTKEEFKGSFIANEPVIPGTPLSSKQMSAIEMSKSMGNQYSPKIEAQYAKQKQAQIAPDKRSASGQIVSQTSTENADMSRVASKPTPVQPIVSNNVTNTTKQSFTPVKAQPRSSSSLDRYQDQVAVW